PAPAPDEELAQPRRRPFDLERAAHDRVRRPGAEPSPDAVRAERHAAGRRTHRTARTAAQARQTERAVELRPLIRRPPPRRPPAACDEPRRCTTEHDRPSHLVRMARANRRHNGSMRLPPIALAALAALLLAVSSASANGGFGDTTQFGNGKNAALGRAIR